MAHENITTRRKGRKKKLNIRYTSIIKKFHLSPQIPQYLSYVNKYHTTHSSVLGKVQV